MAQNAQKLKQINPKRIFVLNGHPAERSLNRSIADAYVDAARDAGHDVRSVQLHDLDFDMDFENGSYKHYKPLEPQLEALLENIEWCEHLVVTTPMWWGGLPAKLKGLFDRTLLPGRTFNTRETNFFGLPRPMLSGRTGRVFITSDTPGWFMRFGYGNAMLNQVRKQILEFIGIKPVKVTWFAGATDVKQNRAQDWLRKVHKTAIAAA